MAGETAHKVSAPAALPEVLMMLTTIFNSSSEGSRYQAYKWCPDRDADKTHKNKMNGKNVNEQYQKIAPCEFEKYRRLKHDKCQTDPKPDEHPIY